MHDQDLRDIKLYGSLAMMSGAVLLCLSLAAILLVLASGGSTSTDTIVTGGILAVTLVILGSALAGLGGNLYRADRNTQVGRESVRLDWTALLLVELVGFFIGIWLLPALAMFTALMLIGLVWIRQPVIRITSH